MRKPHYLLFTLSAFATFTACEPEEEQPDLGAFANGVFVVNEGQFNVGNASLSHYLRADGLVTPDVYTAANQVPLGDVAQSMTIAGDNGYIVVNNSGKVEVVKWRDMSHTATITGLTSPRYLLPLGNGRAFVTDYASNYMAVVDLTTNTKIDSVMVGGWTEELVLLNGAVYVAATGTGRVLKVDPNSNAVLAEVTIGNEPTSMAVDGNGKLWVVTNDTYPADEPSRILRLNPADLSIEASITMVTLFNYPNDLAMSKDGQSLYFIDGQIYKLPIDQLLIPADPFISLGSSYPYSIDVDPVTGNIFVGDGADFQSNGTVKVYNAQGQMQGSFAAGVIPGGFCFTPQE
jgi:DNA-binding beta-propeller fold protein YncE